jgi:Protein of unknown function (DUF1360)
VTHVPGPWQAVLLALAAYRLWRLAALDVITQQLRHWVTRWPGFEDAVPTGYRAELAQFIQCPWCLGFWVAACWWAAWIAWPHAALVAAAPFAISAAVGVLGRFDE